MSEPVVQKKVIVQMIDGQWQIKRIDIAEGQLPITGMDLQRIVRVLRLGQRAHLREFNLSQKSLTKE